jgi:CelD/BcsL family acetyltransferase involved in cellulose biosynthesis
MEFKLYRDFADELETEWNGLLDQSATHVPFLRYEYLKAWWQTRGGGEWPADSQLAIITARQGDRLVGVAPFFIATWEGRPTLLLLGSIEISDYLDLIASPLDMPAFSQALLRYLSDPSNGLPEGAVVELYNVLDASPALPALEQAARAEGWKYRQEVFRPSLYIPLPCDWELYLASIDKKQRHEIRRKMRRLESAEVPTRWYIAQDPAVIDLEIEDFLDLMLQDTEKERFLTLPMRENFRLTMRCAFNAGCLCLAFLEIGGKKAAGYLSFDYLDQLWVYNSGLDRDFIEYSPGWVLLGYILKWANENQRVGFDFMRGDEDYKYRFGAVRRDVMRITLEK